MDKQEHSETKELAGQVAVVISGTSGLGKILALGLEQAGADVVATSRSVDATRSVTDAIQAMDGDRPS